MIYIYDIIGRLDVENKFGHALVQLSLDNPAFTENVMMCEVHQLLKHGHECIAGMLQWITLVLHKVKQVLYIYIVWSTYYLYIFMCEYYIYITSCVVS